MLPVLEPEGAFNREWKRKTHFYSGDTENLALLIKELPLVLLPAVHGKKPGKEMGFIALFTDGRGGYWFRCSRGFHTALNESMASLETLIDELGDDVDIAVKHEVNQTYRRLADLLNG